MIGEIPLSALITASQLLDANEIPSEFRYFEICERMFRTIISHLSRKKRNLAIIRMRNRMREAYWNKLDTSNP